MRVISGASRGRKLVSLDSQNTRPTLDRVKEALFNIIQNKIEDTIVLDLFAGTGALGIEALSRGANQAVFCDKSKEAIRVITKNLENTKNLEKSIIINKDYNQALKMLKDMRFNLVFLDPPYKTDYAILSLQKIIMSNILAEDGLIVIETDDEAKENQIKEIEGIKIVDKRKYGSIWLILIRKG